MLFQSFRDYCVIKEAANKSMGHLLDMAHSNRLMVIISSFRDSKDQPPPRSILNLERDIRNQKGYEVVPNTNCPEGLDEPEEIEGPNAIASLPNTGQMGVTKSSGGFREKVVKPGTTEFELDDKGEPVTRDVCESSLIVSHRRGAGHPGDEEVIDFFMQLAKKYNQEAFIFKAPSSDEIMMVYTTGKVDNLGSFTSVSTLYPYFTMLRKGMNYNDRRVSAKSRPTQADPLSSLNGV